MTITHRPEAQRFEYQENGHTAYLSYRPLSGSPNGADGSPVYAFDHTVVPPELSGRGIGSLLAEHALSHARAQGWTVRPDCPFIRRHIAKHPQPQDLFAR